jgi:hypothetical protein
MASPPFPTPPMPDLPPEQVADARFELRFEDIAQDGRMMVTALPPAVGWTVWNKLLSNHPGERALMQKGVLAILSRLTVDGGDEPIRVDQPVHATGCYQLARERGGERLFMNMWVEVRGARGRVFPVEGPGDPVVAGRVFAEHTFTRPFAPPDQRRVTRLDTPGLPEPDAEYALGGVATAMALPDGALPLDDDYLPDDTAICFGLDHTDSNQHVNSLVYPRLFAEAALRRMCKHGLRRNLLVRHLDVAYRKPSFAGDRVRLHLRGFTLGERMGIAGFLVAEGEPLDKPRCAARIVLS